MLLMDIKKHIESFPSGKVFPFGLSEPFTWRADPGQIAFTILESEMTREDILRNIDLVYEDSFPGYASGDNEYGDSTFVNFEQSSSSYSDGGYTNRMISKIENSCFSSQEDRLIKLAFK